ncbi:hypothetical protein P8C59_008799 [Phyllachora maydis]|uniref:Uncharacterized protein n=1 Tax=Phyllachora maydis TaxID=1825666 RepID=A0AAD9IC62_9PEZI|nr:hypothetical protein P8C59_008799 [Phyllachora maydis]
MSPAVAEFDPELALPRLDQVSPDNATLKLPLGPVELTRHYFQREVKPASIFQAKARATSKVEKLEASVHEKARDVEARDLSIQKRNKAIQQLQEQKLILENETKMLSAKTEESGLRMGELKAKCNTFREKLNAAIKEQQELFIRSRKMCADTLQDMEAERESAELKAKSVEALREKMIGSLRSEIEQAKQEGQQLARTICDLRNRVGDKERELSREKDNIRDLVAKQEVQQELQASLATISAQNKTIVAKLDEQQARLQDQQTESSAQYAAQLAAVTEQLQELQTRILGQPEQWKQCFAPQEESLKGLESKVEGAMTSQAQAVKAISDGLRKDLASHMSEIWQHLEDQEKTLSQQIKDKSEENSSLGSLLAGRDEECEQLQIELEAVDAQTREQDEVIEALNDRIAELEASVSGPEVTAELHSLQTTADRLQQDLMDRETAIAELEQQLHEQEQARLADAHKFGVDMQKTLRLVQERESEKNQAVGAAKKELQVEMERVITEKHSKLDQMQEEKEMLATQLAKLEQAIKAKDNVERDSQALVHSLQAKLDEAEKQRAALARESEARSAEIRELRVHGSKAVSGLEAEMVATQEKASELAERVEQDKVKLDTIFHALERWAVKQGLTTEFGPALGNVREPERSWP